MPDKEQPRSIRFPQALWNAIDRDALRCKRSAVKQMEAILSEYYRLANAEINHHVIKQLQDDFSLPVAVTDDPDLELTEPKKKRKGGRG